MNFTLLSALLVSFVAIQVTHQAYLARKITDTHADVAKSLLEANAVVEDLLNAYGNNTEQLLTNTTAVKEWSVDIQVSVFRGLAAELLKLYEVAKEIAEESPITDEERAILDCITGQEENILTAVEQVAADNGWCNNRLAPKLVEAQEPVADALKKINAQLRPLEQSLKTCIFGDAICYAGFVAGVSGVVTDALSDGDLVDAVLGVLDVYREMFGEDVPACNEKQLPNITLHAQEIYSNVLYCVDNTLSK